MIFLTTCFLITSWEHVLIQLQIASMSLPMSLFMHSNVIQLFFRGFEVEFEL